MEIMLPELLFSVGSSMQDISRDDFSLLNGECDKDVSTTVHRNSLASSPSPIPTTTYGNCPDTPPPLTTNSISSNIETINIKLEDSNSNPYSSNITTWHNQLNQKTDFESSKLLLRNSDDPLISRGASNDDDNPNELKSIAVSANTETTATKITTNIKTDCMPSENLKSTKTVVSSKRNRNANSSGNKTRRKNTFKLRFHHQALPPEYLSHYEMTQNQQNKTNNNNNNNNSSGSNNASKSTSNNNKSKSSLDHIQVAAEKRINAHETVRNWLEKISQIQINPSDNQKDHHIEADDGNTNEDLKSVVRSSRKVVKYSDLPYMGEMTLENSKPRRGRKPKKADICHLIYKNYGTILPGTPQDKMEIETKDGLKHSLLEKCLSKNVKEIKNKDLNSSNLEEPLNLCLRDRSGDSFILSSDDDASDDLANSTRTSPIITQTDSITDAILAANLKMSLPNFQSALLNNKSLDDIPTPSAGDSDQTTSPNYSSWTNSGVFLHPMALYYQKMVDRRNATQSTSNTSNDTVNTSTIKCQSTKSIQNKKQPSPKSTSKVLSQLIKREKSDHTEPSTTPSSTKSSSSTTNSSSTQNPPQPAQKRKRSAIFIPPMPAENTTNPATEVSICKFKFTGGAKPSLQEKKMLSVDSDGNYRYYSGTGDKSTRGYEFFPRETLQQSGVIPGVNCSGAFLNATGEKILGDFPAPSSGLNNELLQIPDSPTNSILFSNSHTPPLLTNTSESYHHHQNRQRHHHLLSSSSQASDRRKRKSRRSIQREKLEQTFKEKGFLIQTQQLESAEGATYCKFRQLRKFTRYLFRSWKDYLPGEIQQANAAAVAAAAAAVANQQASPICDMMIEATSGDVQISATATEKLRKAANCSSSSSSSR